jgi:hypothetical protein
LIINGNNESKKWAWYLEILRLISLISLGIYLPLVYVIPLSVLSILSGIYFYFVMNKNIGMNTENLLANRKINLN